MSVSDGAGADLLSKRFTELYGGGPAQDRVRGQTIPAEPIKLDTLGKWCNHASL